MKESGVIRIKEHPKLMREAALWFHEKWGGSSGFSLP